ncbi:MAG: bifunctional diaminohydroxyphosphoribosylaminopyrimidine deaminase/5-amino-6-(5-phosphoribosylamino)uracil reductase RibD [Chitinophagia bacterium]
MLLSFVYFCSTSMEEQEKFIYRCFELAQNGAGWVAPNPKVGAVLVYKQQVIGEGYHSKYGESHAEVNCLQSVLPEHRSFITESTLYVNLEPCCHFGKTPPCTDLIIQSGIKKVVISNTDPFPQVKGGGIQKLAAAGITVVTDVLANTGNWLNRRFFTMQTQNRPYIILKWAQTQDGFIGALQDDRLIISNELTQRKVHRWRAAEAAILIGFRTALLDNPQLTNRLVPGKQPVRLIIDPLKKLPMKLQVFSDNLDTTIINCKDSISVGTALSWQYVGEDWVEGVIQYCCEKAIESILIEGGAATLQSFIDRGYWNEIRRITNTAHSIGSGVLAPLITLSNPNFSEKTGNDIIEYWVNPQNQIGIPNWLFM